MSDSSPSQNASPQDTPRKNRDVTDALVLTTQQPNTHRLPRSVRESPSWLASFALHLVVLVVLGLWIIPVVALPEVMLESLPALTEEEGLEDIQPVEMQQLDDDMAALSELVPDASADAAPSEVELGPADLLEPEPASLTLDNFSEQTAPKGDLLTEVGGGQSSALSGRTSANRQQIVNQYGGTAQSEAAVAMALKWLADHQNPDGSWSFDHRSGPCNGRCQNPGSYSGARNGATAMALLPFLGAGITHKEGKYQETVEDGLYYLLRSMNVTRNRGSFHDQGTMYSHGLATIALCEAYAMTQDRGLRDPAQHAINFIQFAQDPRGGGWRYKVKQQGDTSVVGWQIMALKSGYMGYLVIDPKVITRSIRFLDSVQSKQGAAYGYSSPGDAPATTAIGLLCRMYLGWKTDHPALEQGVQYLVREEPSQTNLYYDYYATQVLFHYTEGQGPMWEQWNPVMRESLVGSQSTLDHEKGSWFVSDPNVSAGGRLYCTAMATMILEVYYRHMPIYQAEATTADFPE